MNVLVNEKNLVTLFSKQYSIVSLWKNDRMVIHTLFIQKVLKENQQLWSNPVKFTIFAVRFLSIFVLRSESKTLKTLVFEFFELHLK